MSLLVQHLISACREEHILSLHGTRSFKHALARHFLLYNQSMATTGAYVGQRVKRQCGTCYLLLAP